MIFMATSQYFPINHSLCGFFRRKGLLLTISHEKISNYTSLYIIIHHYTSLYYIIIYSKFHGLGIPREFADAKHPFFPKSPNVARSLRGWRGALGSTWWWTTHGSCWWVNQPWWFQWDFCGGKVVHLVHWGELTQLRFVGWTTKYCLVKWWIGLRWLKFGKNMMINSD